jgi:RNA polymerase subunit RPABC4/transcription elongation factor Spt4
MIHCQTCGQQNDNNANFCRFCGNKFFAPQPAMQQDPAAPRPYLWKTDELPVSGPKRIDNAGGRSTQPALPPLANPNQTSQLAYQQPSFVSGYRCPRCGTTNLPYISRQISTAGWVTFSVLLVTTLIFFWVGLLLKEDVRVCPVCNLKSH